mgnify:CR=1 FL=1
MAMHMRMHVRMHMRMHMNNMRMHMRMHMNMSNMRLECRRASVCAIRTHSLQISLSCKMSRGTK